MTFATSILNFFDKLNAPAFSNGIEIINPYPDKEVKAVVRSFYNKYFNDNNPRVFIIGINPGRFGGGITGISFTDPVALKEFCGIENNLGDKKELSSRFIYEIINAYGGPEAFNRKFYLTALYPLAIVNNGKNYNFYDDPKLYATLKPFMISYLQDQIKAGAKKDIAICLGKKNYIFVDKINKEYGFFRELKMLEHPRYIMQYKLKSLPDYIEKYIKVLDAC